VFLAVLGPTPLEPRNPGNPGFRGGRISCFQEGQISPRKNPDFPGFSPRRVSKSGNRLEKNPEIEGRPCENPALESPENPFIRSANSGILGPAGGWLKRPGRRGARNPRNSPKSPKSPEFPEIPGIRGIPGIPGIRGNAGIPGNPGICQFRGTVRELLLLAAGELRESAVVWGGAGGVPGELSECWRGGEWQLPASAVGQS